MTLTPLPHLVCLFRINRQIMPKKRLLQMFNDLPFEGKLVFLGGFLLLASVFMPWYEDLDTFHMGDMFLGVTGPLYLVGFILLFISGLTLFALLSEKKIEKLPIEKHHLNLLVGISSLFLLVLTASVYFHTKFGVNITMKEMRFGMIIAFVSAGLITIGGFLQTKKKNVSFEELDGKIDPLISFPKNDRVPGEIKGRDEKFTHDGEVIREDKQIHL